MGCLAWKDISRGLWDRASDSGAICCIIWEATCGEGGLSDLFELIVQHLV